MTQPVIFISYSHKDEREKNRLLSQLGVLQQEELLDLWSDDRIGAGAGWKQEISEAMAQAKVAILLISANFLTSKFILDEEVPTLLKRRQSEGLIVFPVIARPCVWQEVGWLNGMNVRPKNGRPVWGAGSRRIDEDLAALAQEVAALVKTGLPIASTAIGDYQESKRTKKGTPTDPAQEDAKTIAEIRVLVRMDRLEEAIEKLSKIVTDQREIDQLSRRLSSTQRRKRQGIITDDKAEAEYAQIAGAILDLISP